MAKFTIPLEKQDQESLHKYVTLKQRVNKNILFSFHVPNEGKRKIHTGNSLVKQGLVAGVCDYFIFFTTFVLAIELKRQKPKDSTLTKAQKKCIEQLNKNKHTVAIVCYGLNEAIDAVDRYLKLDKYKLKVER